MTGLQERDRQGEWKIMMVEKEEMATTTVAERRSIDPLSPATILTLPRCRGMTLTVTEKSEADGTSGHDGGQEGIASQASIAGDTALRELGDGLLVVLMETHYGVGRK